MIRLTFIVFSIGILSISACSSTKQISQNPRITNCKQNFKNNFSRLELDETTLNINNKTEKVTEAKFRCVYTFLQSKKVMFDKFGKWNEESLPKNKHHPLLIWNDVLLLENSPERFTVIATGEETLNEETYASISILDENGKDVLAPESHYKNDLIDFFSNLIRETNHEDEEFHKVYLKNVSPKKWEKLYGKQS